MIHLAYDGSINSDWVAWYGLNLAVNDSERRLAIIHIDTGEADSTQVQNKVKAFLGACQEAGVEATFEKHPSNGRSTHHVYRDLVAHVPSTPQTLLVCGARVKGDSNGYLFGTVSEKLLGDTSFSVIAIHVVQPGLLGAPRRLLMPVAGDRKGFLTGASILKRFGSGIERIHLLRVMMLKHNLFRHLDNEQATSLREKGWTAMKGMKGDLAEAVGLESWKVDENVTVSDDWAQEVIIAANRHKIHLIMMEAARRDLNVTYRFGNPIEVVLRNAPCDVAIYRGV